ncbi:PST family polysaccharide transporter [Maribacter caenipelagi]|uniref:PST family polysaccharide transporter n=1 Tax=Maribacter caenipelagi TaxID=1447781 RepID=A0A4R7DHA7_9FLAO|nr:flippase [Maribacter caenipelagi]TDS18646.1 PST family polysaccharide transporter [Maribacter caenipelagi]
MKSKGLLSSKLFRNISWLFFDKIFRMIYGIFVSIVLARYLGPEDFGNLNFSIAFVYVFLVISNLGLESVLVREITLQPKKRQELISTSIFLRGGVALALYFICVLLAKMYHPDINTTLLITIIATQIIFQITDVFFTVFMAEVNSKYVVIAKNIGFLISGLVKLLFVYINLSLKWFAVATALEFLVCLILIIWFINKKTDIVIKFKYFNFYIAKELLKSSYPLIISGVFYVIYTKLDQVMLGYLSTQAEVGYYAVATKFSEVWYFIPVAIVNSFYPELIKKHKEDKNGFNKLIGNLMLVLASFALVLTIFFTFFSEYLITKLYGAEYSVSGEILTIHIWSCLIVFTAVVSGSWFVINKLEKYSFYRTGTGALFNIVLNFILIPIYGGFGAAIATLLAKILASYLMNGMFTKTRSIFWHQTNAYFNVLKIYPIIGATKQMLYEIRRN